MFCSRKPGEEWRFASQRGFPKMALIHTAINPEANTVTMSYPVKVPYLAGLIFGWTTRRFFTVPLNVNKSKHKDKYVIEEVEVWDSHPKAYNMSGHVPQECMEIIFSGKQGFREIGLFA